MVKWVKTIYRELGSWALGVGCRLWRLPPSWFQDDWSEVAEVMAVGRCFQSLMVWGKGVKQDWMIGVLLVQTLCSSCPGVCVFAEADEDVDQPKVEHLESFVEPALFKAVLFHCQAAIIWYQVSCLWNCCRHTLMLNTVPFQCFTATRSNSDWPQCGQSYMTWHHYHLRKVFHNATPCRKQAIMPVTGHTVQKGFWQEDAMSLLLSSAAWNTVSPALCN